MKTLYRECSYSQHQDAVTGTLLSALVMCHLLPTLLPDAHEAGGGCVSSVSRVGSYEGAPWPS
jgi:hypothetical protein